LSAVLAAAVDDLYRDVVMEPERWNEAALGEWLEAVALDAEAVDRDQAKQLRRAVRNAVKLQSFWSAADAKSRKAEPSWRARVDIAVGIPAWRPPLELAMRELDENPSEAKFEDVRERFRVVHGATWLDGTPFSAWSSARSDDGDAR
jgi:hypothetical protein